MYDHCDEGQVLILDMPPLSDPCVLELSEFLQYFCDRFTDGYARQLRRAWQERHAETQSLFELHHGPSGYVPPLPGQLPLPFEEELNDEIPF